MLDECGGIVLLEFLHRIVMEGQFAVTAQYKNYGGDLKDGLFSLGRIFSISSNFFFLEFLCSSSVRSLYFLRYTRCCPYFR